MTESSRINPVHLFDNAIAIKADYRLNGYLSEHFVSIFAHCNAI